jgi:hypothetical protein
VNSTSSLEVPLEPRTGPLAPRSRRRRLERRSVAVGTTVAGHPPHRSLRALLTHRALPSDLGVEAVTWQRVSYAKRREEAVGDLDEPVPCETALFTSSLQRLQPAPAHLMRVAAVRRRSCARKPPRPSIHFVRLMPTVAAPGSIALSVRCERNSQGRSPDNNNASQITSTANGGNCTRTPSPLLVRPRG